MRERGRPIHKSVAGVADSARKLSFCCCAELGCVWDMSLLLIPGFP